MTIEKIEALCQDTKTLYKRGIITIEQATARIINSLPAIMAESMDEAVKAGEKS